MEDMEAAVAAQLTPAQAEKFAKLKEQQRTRMKAMWEERQRRKAEAGERKESDPDRVERRRDIAPQPPAN